MNRHLHFACIETLSGGLGGVRWLVLLLALLAGCGNDSGPPPAPGFVVRTLAGAPGFPGSTDGPVGEARFNIPCGIWIDGNREIYVADSYNHTIRKITSAGIVSTLAGTPGGYGFADGPGAQARFAFPHSVATDHAGNVYIADVHNRVIRRIDPIGVVSTFAGAVGTIGSADGPRLEARFNQPEGVATDLAGNVYVADAGNNAIRKISPEGMVSTLAASGLLASPEGIAVDATGNLYVANGGAQSILKVNPAGEVSLLAGSPGLNGSVDGPGIDARFDTPFAVAIDKAGNIYVTDAFNHTVRRVSPDGWVSTLAGLAGSVGADDGAAGEARFNIPWGIATDVEGGIYVADAYNHTIRTITWTGARMAGISEHYSATSRHPVNSGAR